MGVSLVRKQVACLVESVACYEANERLETVEKIGTIVVFRSKKINCRLVDVQKGIKDRRVSIVVALRKTVGSLLGSEVCSCRWSMGDRTISTDGLLGSLWRCACQGAKGPSC